MKSELLKINYKLLISSGKCKNDVNTLIFMELYTLI